jgi:hypothetical protein
VTFLADPALGFPGMYEKVEQLKKELPNMHVLDQTTNEANPEVRMRWIGIVTRSVRIGCFYLTKKRATTVDNFLDFLFFPDEVLSLT